MIRKAEQGDLLRFSDPQWLQTLSSGANLLLWGIFVNVAVSVVGLVGMLPVRL